MDQYLLTLWNTVSSGNIKQEEIAEVLQLSPKHTTRNIQKWCTQGWLIFTPFVLFSMQYILRLT